MSDFAQVLFQNGYATPLKLARWRAKGALKPLSPNLKLTEQGQATPQFQALWKAAFPSRGELPNDPLHDAEGYISVPYHAVWR